jgi:hypothetical protein
VEQAEPEAFSPLIPRAKPQSQKEESITPGRKATASQRKIVLVLVLSEAVIVIDFFRHSCESRNPGE